MRKIGTLIKLAERRLDGCQRHHGACRSAVVRLCDELQTFDQVCRQESEAAARSIEGLFAYPAYLAATAVERSARLAEIAAAESALDDAAAALTAAYQEMKKFEIVQRADAVRARQAADRHEQTAIDEMALTQHRRKGRA